MQIKYLLFMLLILGSTACDDEQILPNLDEVASPSALSLTFDVDPDDSSLITITPGAQGATLFNLDFGDGSAETMDLQVGSSAVRSYDAGSYPVTLIATGINGNTTTLTETLNVETPAPRNLVVTIASTPGNPLSVDVSATADFETGFNAYFGDVADEVPTAFQEGETISHVYAMVGSYDIRVVALGNEFDMPEETNTVDISTPTTLFINFENSVDTYVYPGFGGASSEVIANPDMSAGNNSSQVMKLNKGSGSEVWAGIFTELDGPIDFSSATAINMKVWSPRAGTPIILKLEDATDGDIFVEVTTNTTMANSWEVLTFDFSGMNLDLPYQKLVFFYDFGTAGMNEDFYFDDIILGEGDGGGGGDNELSLPLDFQSSEVTYAFDNFGGASADPVDNPDASGINTSSQVGRFSKNIGSEVWGGVFIDMTNPIDFSSTQTVRLKVWSPKVGAKILLKFENPANPDDNLEVIVLTTISNQWEELEYDFNGIENFPNIKRVVIFCDFEADGTDENYYFDDIKLVN
ncbi:MAG: hypothetical protein ACJAZ9_000158 [Neolewinella sp.]|jgi:hypothetical protein